MVQPDAIFDLFVEAVANRRDIGETTVGESFEEETTVGESLEEEAVG